MKFFLLSLLLGLTLWADAHIFIYHRFGDSRYPSTNTSIEELRKEFDYFKNNGYEVIPLQKLVEALQHKQTIPDNWVVLTIDDNYQSFYDNGLALFREYNYPFSMFIYVDATDKKYGDFMRWEKLKEIAQYGALEFHSLGHPHMTQMSDEALKKDFEVGLSLFEKNLGFKPHYFSYPFGEFSPRVKSIAQSFGFEAMLNQNMGAVSSLSDPMDLDRSALVGKSDLQNFLKYKTLDASWVEPTTLLKDGKVGRLHVKTSQTSKKGGIYITEHGYREAKLENGEFIADINKTLTQERTRIMVSVGNHISTKLLVKDFYGTK